MREHGTGHRDSRVTPDLDWFAVLYLNTCIGWDQNETDGPEVLGAPLFWSGSKRVEVRPDACIKPDVRALGAPLNEI